MLTRQVEIANCAEIYGESGWKQHHRIIDCAKHASMHFLKETVRDLNINQGRVMVIPFIAKKKGKTNLWITIPSTGVGTKSTEVAKSGLYNTANWTRKTSEVKKS